MMQELEPIVLGEISITSGNADDTTLMAEKKGTKEPLMKVKRRVKYWLKTQHSKKPRA